MKTIKTIKTIKPTPRTSTGFQDVVHSVSGSLNLTVVDSISGEVRNTLHLNNVVVNTGKAYIASCLAGSPRKVDYIALGLTKVNAVNTDIKLDGEITRKLIQEVIYVEGTPYVTYTATFEPGIATGPISEAGIIRSLLPEEDDEVVFDSPSVIIAPNNEMLLSRTVFPMVNKRSIDSVTIDWTITIN